jgi:hypothetical protein
VLRAADAGGKWTHRGQAHRRAAARGSSCVRQSPAATSKILLQLCSNTYNAYNNWGGFSVYAYNSLSKNQGSRVSFERPGSVAIRPLGAALRRVGGAKRLPARIRRE